MISNEIDRAYKQLVKIAGLTFLFFPLMSIVHYGLVDLNFVALSDMGKIINYIKTNEILFRFGIVLDFLIFVAGLVMSLALYYLLKPVQSQLALFALILMILQAAICIVIELTSFAALLIVGEKSYLLGLGSDQLEGLLGLFINLRLIGYNVAIIFFSPAFFIFSYLFLKSRYIPKLLAGLGMVSLSLMFLWALIKMLVPNFSTVIPAAMIYELLASVPVMFFQIAMGLWLLWKGIGVKVE